MPLLSNNTYEKLVEGFIFPDDEGFDEVLFLKKIIYLELNKKNSKIN